MSVLAGAQRRPHDAPDRLRDAAPLRFLGRPLDVLGNVVPVHRPPLERPQNEHVERATEKRVAPGRFRHKSASRFPTIESVDILPSLILDGGERLPVYLAGLAS